MRIPSRYMPKIAAPSASLAQKAVWLAFYVGFVAMLGYCFVSHPLISTAVCGAIGFSGWWDLGRTEKRRAALSASRGDEGLCQFARSFDSRQVDTWIIRAVFDALQEELGGSGVFPLRASDRLAEDLHIDHEDLDLALAPVIAARTGRTLDDCSANPYWGKVTTVADLVHFFNAQPGR